MTHTYGSIYLSSHARHWHVRSEPHVLIRMKRLFEGVAKGEIGEVSLSNTPEHCSELLWFLDRYPLRMSDGDKRAMRRSARQWKERVQRLTDMLDPGYKPPAFDLALPPRDYQRRAAAVYLNQGSLLLADDLGLGKTCVAICSMADARTLPAVVVCYPHLQLQWKREIEKFAPTLTTHIVEQTEPYELPRSLPTGRGPDVLIITYHKLSDWAQVLAKYCRSIVFDEAQELRRGKSEKYRAATKISQRMAFRLGLTATPIYNYGGEMFSVLNALAPGAIGTFQEFYREWCTGKDDKASISDPAAFGSYVREQGLMLRRTRAEVGRELPPVIRVTHEIESDAAALNEVADKAAELARIILDSQGLRRGEAMQAAEEFSNVMRQATGIAKAPYVAEFVKMLTSSGRPVVLCGWHHAVYDIWQSHLQDLRVARYTGEETPKQKDLAREQVLRGEVDVLILSLRSGAGLDGLQEACSAIVFGELDWSPGVHEQCIGRLHRDGQNGDVTAYFLISNEGADPVMCRVLGLKRDQVDGIRDPHGALIERLDRSGDHIRSLAEQYLTQRGTRSRVVALAESA